LLSRGGSATPHITRDGLRISYDDAGRGEPALLFMPGWCSDRTVFDPLAARCQAHRRTLTLDWRGRGQSGRPDSDFGSRELSDDALAVVEASGAPAVVPVALSHAGWIALEP
jgi:pimeloyl-ACP methyl ester carboxylesterase